MGTQALETRAHMPFYILTKGYTIPGNRGTHDKLNQIQNFSKNFKLTKLDFLFDYKQKSNI